MWTFPFYVISTSLSANCGLPSFKGKLTNQHFSPITIDRFTFASVPFNSHTHSCVPACFFLTLFPHLNAHPVRLFHPLTPPLRACSKNKAVCLFEQCKAPTQALRRHSPIIPAREQHPFGMSGIVHNKD